MCYVDIPFDLVVIYSSRFKIGSFIYDSLSIVDEVVQLLPLSNSIQAGFNLSLLELWESMLSLVALLGIYRYYTDEHMLNFIIYKTFKRFVF